MTIHLHTCHTAAAASYRIPSVLMAWPSWPLGLTKHPSSAVMDVGVDRVLPLMSGQVEPISGMLAFVLRLMEEAVMSYCGLVT